MTIAAPNRFTWRRLGDLCERIDYGFTASADFSTREPRFLRITDIQNGKVLWDKVPGCKISKEEAEANRLLDGDIVFARTGATTGKSFLITNPPDSVFASYLIRLRLKPGIEPEFLSLFFQSEQYWEQIRAQARGGIQPNFNATMLANLRVLCADEPEQEQITNQLRGQLAEVERARAAVAEQLKAAEALVNALLRQSLNTATEQPLSECLHEVTAGVGEDWAKYPLLGATRAGVAPAKEPVGKSPQRYKPVRPGTIFYNPMRILLGSIAMIDEGEAPGITSPDYVVMTGVANRLHPRWFYYWFRSKYGAEFIKSLSRGAVRERLLFKRLAPARIPIPDWKAQQTFARQLGEIRGLRIALRRKLESIEAIPTGLLREAFSGRF